MQHSIATVYGELKATLIWFALQCSSSKQCTEIHGYDHMLVSRRSLRARYPLLMAYFITFGLGFLNTQRDVCSCPFFYYHAASPLGPTMTLSPAIRYARYQTVSIHTYNLPANMQPVIPLVPRQDGVYLTMNFALAANVAPVTVLYEQC